MSRRDKRAKGGHGTLPYVQLHHWLLESAAWRDLTPNARAVYIELKMRYRGANNGDLALSTRDAGTAIKVSNSTAARAFQELIDHGFVAVAEDSSFSRKVRQSRRYRLTEAANDRVGEPREATKEFMRWAPQEPARNPKHSLTHETMHSLTHETRTAPKRPGSLMGETVRARFAGSQSHG